MEIIIINEKTVPFGAEMEMEGMTIRALRMPGTSTCLFAVLIVTRARKTVTCPIFVYQNRHCFGTVTFFFYFSKWRWVCTILEGVCN